MSPKRSLSRPVKRRGSRGTLAAGISAADASATMGATDLEVAEPLHDQTEQAALHDGEEFTLEGQSMGCRDACARGKWAGMDECAMLEV